jgi:DNA excision repair protein ERCC-2
LALKNYRKACDSGRGALFISIARGKVSEGIDFDHHYGRCVVMIGIPFVNTDSRVIKTRTFYMNQKYGIKEADFINFDAMRQTSQCIGRVIRNKTDYGIMVLADGRYSKKDKIEKLPEWIKENLKDEYLNLSTETFINISKKFLREMSQSWESENSLGISLLNSKYLVEYIEKKN